MTAEALISKLGLQPHPEGGHYREIFRSDIEVGTPDGARSAGTTIFYLLEGSERSHFHRIDADEIWFHHQGGALNIVCLEEDGSLSIKQISQDMPQAVIPKGVWFGAALEKSDDYCLTSCAVMPAFEFSGFEMASRAELLDGWPDHKDWIEKLTDA